MRVQVARGITTGAINAAVLGAGARAHLMPSVRGVLQIILTTRCVAGTEPRLAARDLHAYGERVFHPAPRAMRSNLRAVSCDPRS